MDTIIGKAVGDKLLTRVEGFIEQHVVFDETHKVLSGWRRELGGDKLLTKVHASIENIRFLWKTQGFGTIVRNVGGTNC